MSFTASGVLGFIILCLVIFCIIYTVSDLVISLCKKLTGKDSKPDELYWQKVQAKAAIAAMQGLIANPQTAEQIDHNDDYKEIRNGDKVQLVAMASVMYAGALVLELKKWVNND